MTIAYQTIPATREFVGEVAVDEDPLDKGNLLIPRGAVLSEPPTPGEDQVAVWEGAYWSLKEDHRGKTVYDMDNGEELVIKSIGPIPSGYSVEKPEIEPTPEEKCEAVNAYREYVVSQGVTVTIDETSIPVQTRNDKDLSRIDSLASLAGNIMATGGSRTFKFRGADNVTRSLSETAMFDLGAAVFDHISGIYDISWDIKDEIRAGNYEGDPMADSRWP
ncbi:DUF4376 domain-containing protein [Marivibrio halodurans]|uniref:DUF4376 domain-containing protein n=1 Tax=Marivibrio halodurans TaxID=2039722 RepID=A0A8J7RVX8_9PROT|nr:DUF4376 domain-containing protein [Marivibrio halodurans]MBP5855677.1 DUF4376 domain-containing protein [Marivibrio halodurans]